MIDFARKPARQQAVPLNRIEVLIRRLCYLLAQKEIRMLKQCGYCRKSIDEGKEVKTHFSIATARNWRAKKRNIVPGSVLNTTRWRTKVK